MKLIAPEQFASMSPAEQTTCIREANATYLAFPRAGGDADAILDAKLTMARWRSQVLEQLLTSAQANANTPEHSEHLVEALLALNLHLDASQQQRAASLIDDTAQFARVLANQGTRMADAPALHALAGPDTDLKIEVNRASPWSFAKWQQIPAFAEYAFRDDGVDYRGFHLRPGDVILANVNLDGNAVYTALSEPKGYCPHSAVFVMLDANGKRYPAVIETYEKGLRAVPLNVFLNARYVAYAEIYRHQHMTDAQRAQMGAAATTAIERARGYNFFTNECDGDYVSCTSLAQILFRAVNLAPVTIQSGIHHHGVQQNLKRLGYEAFTPFFAPVDFLLSDDFRCVGWVDNNQFPRLLARELVERRFRQLFERGELRISRMPLMHHLNHWGIGHMRRQTFLGGMISRVMGFDHLSLPRGPDPLLAIITPAEAQLGRSVQKLMPAVTQHLSRCEQFDLNTTLQSAKLQQAVQRHVRLRWL